MYGFMNKNQKQYHHKESHRPHPSHAGCQGAGDGKAGTSLLGEANAKTKEIKILRKVLDVNDEIARQNRKIFEEKGVFVINVMSSPGSGKTTILEKTLAHIAPAIRCGVIVGDICTSNDADRLSGFGAPVVQVNTDAFGGDCHLAAHVIKTATDNFDLDKIDLLIIENLGNLVCPAEFDMGEHLKIVVLSVTEGEDKPLKYPLMFRVCHAALLNKIDLLPHLDYDKEAAVQNILKVNSKIKIFEISAKTEDGFDSWIKWLEQRYQE
ncbi:MAG: hydrogenase nickel incorporation protein HypB [Desulfobacterales bacterium]|jgi:hydrogenase nickel incorporation protein HypB